MWMGVILLGVYWALSDPTGAGAGALFAFMMLSQRVAQPLVQLAKLTDEYQDVAASIGQAASVLNRPLEVDAASGGMRPTLRRRDQLRRCDVHLWRHQGAGARPHHLLDPGRHDARHRRALGFGQVDHHPPAARHQPRLFGLPEDRRLRPARDQPAASAAELRRRAAGQLPVPRLDPRQHPRRPARPDARGCGARGTARRRRGIHRAHAERLRNLHRGRLAQPVGRPEAAPRHRARADQRSAHPDPRRGHQRARSGKRGAGQRQPAAHRARPHDGHRVAPAVIADRMRPDPGSGQGHRWSTSRRTASCSNAAPSIASSGRSRTVISTVKVHAMPRSPRPSSKAISTVVEDRRRSNAAGHPRIPDAVDGDHHGAGAAVGARHRLDHRQHARGRSCWRWA